MIMRVTRTAGAETAGSTVTPSSAGGMTIDEDEAKAEICSEGSTEAVMEAVMEAVAEDVDTDEPRTSEPAFIVIPSTAVRWYICV
jgi:hypothetical protein